MAAVVAQVAKERKSPTLRYQVLFCPATDASFSQESYKEFANGLWNTAAVMKWCWDAYVPNKTDRKKAMASPCWPRRNN